jgi:hypothetical protein
LRSPRQLSKPCPFVVDAERLLARGSTLHFRHVRVVFVCHFPPQFCEMQESETNVGSAVVKGTRVKPPGRPAITDRRSDHYLLGAPRWAPAAYAARTSSARSLRTSTYPFWAMHPRADAVGVPLSRLASQAAISLFPCCNSAGSSAILRPSVRTHAISGRVEVVTHPESRINPPMKQYARLRCRTNSPGTLLRPMIRTPGRTWRQTAKSSPARHTRLPRRFEVVAQAEMCAWTNSTCP